MPLRSPFPASTDMRLRIIGPFVLFLTGIMFFRLKMYLDLSGNMLINQVCIALTIGYIGWWMTRAAALWIQKKLPGLQRTRKRLYVLIIALVILSHVGYGMRVFVHIMIDNIPWKWPSLLDYSDTMGVVIFYTTVILGIYEGGYVWKQWKRSIAEKEKLIRSQWQSKYDLLKTQINPHFLFNSLNSLSSLIIENPQQAEKFTDEMSNVYRYLLRNNDTDLATLAAELKFIRSYSNLLTTRYGEGFRLHINVPESYHDYLIPSLTLQLLVENAVKHNTVQKKQPLEVIISMSEDGQLSVENNVQKKTTTVISNGVGLSNINSKFKLLNQKGISITESNDSFRVLVPLLRDTERVPESGFSK